jgi:UDP-N-acetylglucosamine 4-epimerase
MEIYLVTGGAGFIGSHLAEELARRKHRVKVLDNFLTGKRENLEDFLDKIELIEGDIRDIQICREAVEGVDFVLHQAALPSVPRSVENPCLTNEINITGTVNMLLASKEAGVKRFVFASSSAVYGDEASLPKKEGKEGNLLSPYAVSKLAGERYCQNFYLLYGLSTVCLRYFNVFGPRQDPFSQYAAAIPNFITKILNRERPTIFGDGEQSRDFSYVANIVDANILASKVESVSGEVFNIACAEQITVNTLASKINEILGTQIQPIHDEPRPGDIRHSLADISKATKMLKYEPKFSFQEGLVRTIKWYQRRRL